jgi:hypothetical protein
MTAKKNIQPHNYIFVTTTEIQVSSMTAAMEAARKHGVSGHVAVVEIDDKGDGKGGIINEDFAAIIATVMN